MKRALLFIFMTVCVLGMSACSSKDAIIVNDKHSFKVCFRFHQPGLDGIAQTVLCGLVDDVERLKGLHTG